ncbi:MAG: hypothetical protein DCF25_02720 [Leptolyngbya foveolarum]|uniref:Uncharacterized protein n=1 Tax=Leptolyngbya foveolarum TaxID=47253 RepID=A0A2W4UQ03_9CYAN|nr:MAG: hypothetical protein DCF25_02720 [Leptolyngbya foveolarum]
MRRLLLISLATIPLTGCQFFNKGPDVAVIDPLDPASSSEAISSSPNGGEATDADAEAFADPTVKSAGASTSADLIKSTDASSRTLAVQRSRSDPFATLPIPPPPELAELPVGAAGTGIAAGGSGATRGASASGSGASRGAIARTGAAGNGGRAAATTARRAPTPPPVRVQPANRPLVNPSPIAKLPPVPLPVIAQAVSVSGVIQLSNEPYAILRLGSEPERYVKVGDRIAGGSVRVKRIETLAFEPRVILEENGIEVSKPITASAPAESPAPNLPVSLPPVPVPSIPAPGNQALLPNVPVIPIPTASTTLQPALGAIPSSLILSALEPWPQAVVPGLPVVAISST